MKKNDGFEWTEDFDGKIINNNKICYFNLKFVCDKGGAQTRSLREVYHFISYQLEHLLKFNTTNKYFINILDGDTCYNYMNIYLKNKNKYSKIIKYIFIGNMKEFEQNKTKIYSYYN